MDAAAATGKQHSSVTLDRPVYHISAVAALAAVHPQTLRLYERQGLLKPSRSRGNTRLYSERDVERLRLIVHLTRDEGVNLAGVSKILELQETIQGVEAAIQGWMEGWQERIQRELSARHEPLRPARDDRDASVKIAIRRG
jgi:MerR family transcriptional regulator/heat shock protein HspR